MEAWEVELLSNTLPICEISTKNRKSMGISLGLRRDPKQPTYPKVPTYLKPGYNPNSGKKLNVVSLYIMKIPQRQA